MTRLPLTWPSARACWPNEQVIPAERSGTLFTSSSNCKKTAFWYWEKKIALALVISTTVSLVFCHWFYRTIQMNFIRSTRQCTNQLLAPLQTSHIINNPFIKRCYIKSVHISQMERTQLKSLWSTLVNDIMCDFTQRCEILRAEIVFSTCRESLSATTIQVFAQYL